METFGLGPTADDLEALLRVARDHGELRLDASSFRSPFLLEAIRGLRGRVILVVDARWVTAERASILREAGLHEIEADLPIHPGQSTREGMQHAARAGLPVRMRFTLRRETLGAMAEAVRFTAAVGARTLYVVLADESLGSREALRELSDGFAAAKSLGADLRPECFERCDEASAEGEPVPLTAAIVNMLDRGVPVPFASSGVLASQAGRDRLAEIGGDPVDVALALRAWGATPLDLPACLGGRAKVDPDEPPRRKSRECASCPLDASCPGVPFVTRVAVRPRMHWRGIGQRIAIVAPPCGDPIMDRQTLPALARRLKERGADVAIFDRNGLWARGPRDSAEGLDAFLEKTDLGRFDAIVLSGFEAAATMVARGMPSHPRIEIVDFHMLKDVERLAKITNRARELWPDDRIGIVSCFGSYAHLYRSWGIPMRQLRFRPYALELAHAPRSTPVLRARAAFAGGGHLRDWRTLELACGRLSSTTRALEVAHSPNADVARVGPMRPLGTLESGAFWSRIASSRFVVLPLVASPVMAAGLTVVSMAFAVGRPVVATRTLSTKDHIRDGIDGILVPPGDPAALADAIERLDRDDALAARLAEGAREAGHRLSTRTWAEELMVGARGE